MLSYSQGQAATSYLSRLPTRAPNINRFLPSVAMTSVPHPYKYLYSGAYEKPSPLRRNYQNGSEPLHLTTSSSSGLPRSADVSQHLPSAGQPNFIPFRSSFSYEKSTIPTGQSYVYSFQGMRSPPASQYIKNIGAANTAIRAGQTLEVESHQLQTEVARGVQLNAGNVEKALGARLNDIRFWRNEINQEIELLLSDTDKITRMMPKLDKLLKDLDKCLQVCDECLREMESYSNGRPAQDSPEEALHRERQVIGECQAMVEEANRKITAQCNSNRAALHELEKDARDKYTSLTIDLASSQVHERSSNVYNNCQGVETMGNFKSTPETYAKFSNNNIGESQSRRAVTRGLHADVSRCLMFIHAEVSKIWNNVNVKLSRRIAGLKEIKVKIAGQLEHVLKQCFTMEKERETLKMTIANTEPEVKCTQARLGIRMHRPHNELCWDNAQSGMMQQLGFINHSTDALHTKLYEMDQGLQRLIQSRLALENDLAQICSNLYLNEGKIQGLRRIFPISDYNML